MHLSTYGLYCAPACKLLGPWKGSWHEQDAQVTFAE